MKSIFARFVSDESGATAIEYGLIAAILSVGIITVLGQVSDQLNLTFEAVETGLTVAP